MQRLSDSYWLNMSTGLFQSSATGNTLSKTDSSITGQGYAGLVCGRRRLDDLRRRLVAFDRRRRALTGGTGVVTVSGVNASLLDARKLVAAAGVINITGKNATLQAAAFVTGSPSTVDLVGVNASLLDAHKLVAAAGVVNITGVNATLLYPYTLPGGTGIVTVSGVNASLGWGHVEVASAGVVNVSGINATLAESGTLTIYGSPGIVQLARTYGILTDDHILPGGLGTVTIAGVGATLLFPFTLPGGVGTVNIVGVNAGVGQEYSLFGSPTAITIIGVAAALFVTPAGGGPGPVSYHVYANTGAGDAINYTTPIDTTSGLTYTTSPLSYPGTWSFGVRAFYVDSMLEEKNLDCYVTIILDASGHDITNRPAPPTGLRAFPLAQGAIRAEWYYPPTTGAKTPTGFHVYTAIGVLNYATPTATVLWSKGVGNSFVANMPGFADGVTYTVGVRAFNAVAEETNTNTVTVTAIATGPAPVDSLTAVATSQA